MSRYRHWKNIGCAKETVFVTTTCLDFCDAFQRSDVKNQIMRLLADEHQHKKAIFHAFVIMSNHIHFLATLPDDRDVGWFVQRIKTNYAKKIAPMLTHEELSGFEQQKGLNAHSFWKKSFRSVVVEGDEMFRQKIDYIHENPVRAGLCSEPRKYKWSSARYFESGLWRPEVGLAHIVLGEIDTLTTESSEG